MNGTCEFLWASLPLCLYVRCVTSVCWITFHAWELNSRANCICIWWGRLCQTEVTYLEYILKGVRNNFQQTQQPLRSEGFSGSAGLCKLWIPGFVELAQPYVKLKGRETPFYWIPRMKKKPFDEIKEALLNGPALPLPDVTKPFHLYVDKIRGSCQRETNANHWPVEEAGSLLIKKIGPVGCWLASLPLYNSNNSLTN